MRNKLYGLIRGLRLSVSIPAGILVHIGSRLNNIETNWLLVATISIICGLTMLTNDYYDRYHDRIKRRYFAWENDKLVLTCVIAGWLLVFGTTWIWLPHKLPLFIVCIVCIFYSISRYVYTLPILLTACVSASAVLLPALGDNNHDSIDMFITVFIAIFGREILKDYENRTSDVKYKKTFFTENPPEEHAWWIRLSGFCLVLSAGKVIILSLAMDPLAHTICITGAECILVSGLVLIFAGRVLKKFNSKTIFDIGMLLVLLSLCV